MFHGEFIMGAEGLEKIRAIRKAVFVDELGIPEAEEFDRTDDCAIHVLITSGEGEDIAAARMYPFDGALHIDRLAVTEKYRGQLYDDLMVRMMLDRARTLPFTRITAALLPEQSRLVTPFGFSETGRTALRGREHVLLECERDAVTWHSQCGGH